MAEFTPWYAIGHPNGGWTVQDRPKGAGRVIAGYPGRDISREEAHMIAAAWDLYAAALVLEEAETAWANCSECGGEEMPELCPACFPLFDNARLMRRAALAKASGKES